MISFFSGLFACTPSDGCGGEAYGCEWQGDPPRCCDPCDRCGNWIGPGAGYRAPYAHAYAPSGRSYVGAGRPQPYVASGKPQSPPAKTSVANRGMPRPKATTTKPVARKPQQGPKQSYQR